jgi:hypothetical protein
VKVNPQNVDGHHNILYSLCMKIMNYGILIVSLAAAWSVNGADVKVIYTFADKTTKTVTKPLVHEGNVEHFRLKAADLPAGVNNIEVLPDYATAKTGEDGYFVMPNGYLGTFRLKDAVQFVKRVPMPVYGMKTTRCTFAAIVTGMPNAFYLIARAKAGVYTCSSKFTLDRFGMYDDIAIDFHMLSGDDANYSGIARTYRKYQLDRKACTPLTERIKKHPELAYCMDSPEIRVRQAWKPAPSPVEEQTLETEPPMKVTTTFDRVGDIVDSLKKAGVTKAEICLVGWNRKGHDGRYPQIFPVEPDLGGEVKLRALIKKAQKAGFQIVGHTNSSDAYRISNVWDEEYVIKTEGGKLSKNAAWSGGRMYNLCPQRSYELFAIKDLPAVAKLGFRGAHYIDVLSIVKPRACYNDKHPLNADQSALWVNKILALGRENFGAIASEGGYDFCCDNLDYALYVSFDPYGLKNKNMIDRIVPFWQLVYHGIILSNPFSKTTNYTIKDKLARVKLAEFGGRPLFYFDSKFVTTKKNWMGDEDITCATDEALASAVKAIKAGVDDYKVRKYLQSEFMEKHEMLTLNVSRTVYSDGSEIIANAGDVDYSYKGRSVEAMNYAVINARN